MTQDKRPDPKPRKHPHLWQAYLWWDELMQMRKRHNLRISSIEAEKSNLDAQFERDMMETVHLDLLIDTAQKQMVGFGGLVGPVWEWLVSIKGIGDHSAAKLLAQFDDVGKFATVSKFWRFSGWGLDENKQIDRCRKGEKSPYNRRLKSECYLIAENFVRHQTPIYVDIYYAEKDHQRRKHPDVICTKCDGIGEQVGQKWRCSECKQANSNRALMFTPGHLDARAKRKMIKIFLQHLWVIWRESEGLPVSEPYVQAVLGHTHIIDYTMVVNNVSTLPKD